MIEYQPYLQLIINAFFTGIGVSLGSYFTTKMIIKQLEEEKQQEIKKIKKVEKTEEEEPNGFEYRN